MKLKKTYSSREVASLTGLTARQLQLWDAGGLLSPAIPSHRTAAGGHTERRYTPIELFELLVLADLRRRGFTIHQLRTILRILDEQFGTRLFGATGGGGGVQLLTDGEEVYARHRARRVFQPAACAGAAAARRRKRRLAEGAEFVAEIEEEAGEEAGQGEAGRQRIGKTFSRSSAGRGMT